MDLLRRLEIISEYIALVNVNDFAATPRHVKFITTQMASVKKHPNYTNKQISLDVAMFCAKLYPMKPRQRYNGKVHCVKKQHERLRQEEILQLKHRITKNIARFTDTLIYEMWKTNPDAILPKSRLKW